MSAISLPHSRRPLTEPRDQLLARVLDELWMRYRERVDYVRVYERVLADAGGTFENDHVAFRTLASQSPTTGIVSVARVFEAMGYVPSGCYQFPDKHLSAIHYEHPQAGFPKLFISELQTWRLSPANQEAIRRCVASHRPPPSDVLLAQLANVAAAEVDSCFSDVLDSLETLPWSLPDAAIVEAVNQESQYAAWTLLHGYRVNHFTALINSHGVPELDDIEKTVRALTAAGVPMKAEIEGALGSKLRQSTTAAVNLRVPVSRDGRPDSLNWTYAYFELAERGWITEGETGERRRFEGFLGAQASQLFETTRVDRSSQIR